MQIGHHHFHTEGGVAVRAAPAVGLLMVWGALLGAAPAAQAGPEGFDGHEGHGLRREEVRQQIREAQHDARMEHPAATPPVATPVATPVVAHAVDPAHPEAHAVDPRSFEGRAEEQRRLLPQDGGRRMGHMTADERRDLRRQINEAGQDLYALPPHH